MSLHALTEFGGGGHKSSGWDWQSCPRSLGPTRSGCKVAVDAATPRSRGLSGFGDNDIAASIKIHINHFTTRPHFPLSKPPCQKPSSLTMPVVIFKAGQTTLAACMCTTSIPRKDKREAVYMQRIQWKYIPLVESKPP